jgi:tellurite methyltransferase
MARQSPGFFEAQFRRQIRERDYAMNPFETLALEHLTGTVLDLGAGLGNLSLEAGRRGHDVLAVEACRAAVSRINADAQRDGLKVRAICEDIGTWDIDRDYDTIVSVGLLMFFRRERALELLRGIREHVNPGGRAIVNVLTVGTTFMGMFDRDNYYLFQIGELEEHFAGWNTLAVQHDTVSAREGTSKVFTTLIAERLA